MQKVRVPITNFQFGEVSPSLYSRTDSDIYTASAQRVENLFLRAEGGVIKRAGLENIYEYDTTIERTIDITNAYSNGSVCWELRGRLEQADNLNRWINERGNDQHETILELVSWSFN